MPKGLTRSGVIGLILLVAGLALGLWPRHIDTVEFTDVSCGTPFFPANSPSGQLRDPWGDVLGYNPADSGRAILGTLCWDPVDEESYAGMTFVALGGLVLAGAWWASRSGSGRATGREAYWRRQGWAPPEELDGPPPGWQRRSSAVPDGPAGASQQYPPPL